MNTRLVNCHLFDHPVPIASALLAVASQENHDGPEDDLMVCAAEYIRVFESLVDFIDNRHNDIISYIQRCNAHVPTVHGFDEDSWFNQQDDPGIARKAIDLYEEL